MRLPSILPLLVLSLPLLAQAPDDAFDSRAASAYRGIIQGLSATHRLDDDGPLGARLRAVSARLEPAAARSYPASRTWAWEVHATTDPAVAAFCIAGGKMLVGAGFVERLGLDDDGLAMLLAHEMGHALAGHRRERAPSGGMEDDVAWENRQAAIALAQEEEADRIGIGLAQDAGFPIAGLLGFYDKLAAAEPAGTFNATHPSARKRAAQARAWAAAHEAPLK